MRTGDLNSGRTECQSCFNRECAAYADLIFRRVFVFGLGTTNAIACLRAATLSRSVAGVVLPNLRLVVQDHVQEGVADF
jgi:hypothetical protein